MNEKIIRLPLTNNDAIDISAYLDEYANLLENGKVDYGWGEELTDRRIKRMRALAKYVYEQTR